MLPEYLLDTASPGEVDFRDRGPQLSRTSRALKIWLSVQAFGLDAFRAAVARGIANAERAQRAVERTEGLEVVTPAQLGIVTFRHTSADAAELVERVVADGFAAPSSTILRGEGVVRLCMLNPRTTDADIDATIARIAALAV
jgi:glutamate/tyrosine decarboxylase-like PLP-dependent enzyme